MSYINKKLSKAIDAGATAQVAVEGANFMHILMKKIDNDPRYEKICLWDYKSENTDEERWLRAMNAAQAGRGVTGIGIICDIDINGDDGRQQRIDRTKSIFNRTFDRDLNADEVSPGSPNLGFFVVPIESSTGCLETALLENPKSDFIECAESFAVCIENNGGIKNQNARDKILVRSLITAHNPDMDYSTSGQTSLWDWDSGSLKKMLDFLESMNSQCA